MTDPREGLDVLLSGTVGSTAYNLATETSDIDTGGVYRAPLFKVLGLHARAAMDHTVSTPEGGKPDYWYHELSKFISLCMKCNPTALELLYLKDYNVLTPEGGLLISNRNKFLFEKGVRNAYGGYAHAQAERLMRRNEEGKEGFSSDIKNRTAKHGRHCYRLLRMGSQLLKDGTMDIDCGQYRDEIFAAGELASNHPQDFYDMFQISIEAFNEVPTFLPAEPDEEILEQLLIDIRLRDYV